jgi:hypothetical protein
MPALALVAELNGRYAAGHPSNDSDEAGVFVSDAALREAPAARRGTARRLLSSAPTSRRLLSRRGRPPPPPEFSDASALEVRAYTCSVLLSESGDGVDERNADGGGTAAAAASASVVSAPPASAMASVAETVVGAATEAVYTPTPVEHALAAPSLSAQHDGAQHDGATLVLRRGSSSRPTVSLLQLPVGAGAVAMLLLCLCTRRRRLCVGCVSVGVARRGQRARP